MRAILLVITLAFSIGARANCLWAIYDLGIRSDYPVNVHFDSVIAPGETVNNYRGQILFTNETDEKLDFYRVSGSVHSGYFLDGVVISAKDCTVIDHFELASE